MRYFLFISIFLIFTVQTNAQKLEKPNFSMASHPILIDNIVYSEKEIEVELTIENQTSEGNFCADKNIYLIDAVQGTRIRMKSATGIPICPETYSFLFEGEKRTFQLLFPTFELQPKYIDIIEECPEYCLSIQGIILDPVFNQIVNNGYNAYKNENTDEALEQFTKAVSEYPDYPYAFLYTNIIQIFAENQDFTNAKQWLNRLNQSDLKDKQYVLEQMKKQPWFEYIH